VETWTMGVLGVKKGTSAEDVESVEDYCCRKVLGERQKRRMMARDVDGERLAVEKRRGEGKRSRSTGKERSAEGRLTTRERREERLSA
jgi:hypothetical protein